MTLYVVGDLKKPITAIPNRLLFDGWKSRLDCLELRAIEFELDRLVTTWRGGEIQTARWLAREISPRGRQDWTSSPLMRIWETACERDKSRTCWCFGLFLWQHMIGRPEPWHFVAGDLGDVPMAATRYRRAPPPKQTVDRAGMASP